MASSSLISPTLSIGKIMPRIPTELDFRERDTQDNDRVEEEELGSHGLKSSSGLNVGNTDMMNENIANQQHSSFENSLGSDSYHSGHFLSPIFFLFVLYDLIPIQIIVIIILIIIAMILFSCCCSSHAVHPCMYVWSLRCHDFSQGPRR